MLIDDEIAQDSGVVAKLVLFMLGGLRVCVSLGKLFSRSFGCIQFTCLHIRLSNFLVVLSYFFATGISGCPFSIFIIGVAEISFQLPTPFFRTLLELHSVKRM